MYRLNDYRNQPILVPCVDDRTARSARRRFPVRRLSKYALVGISGLGLVTLLFWILHSLLGLHYLVAGVLANEAAVFSNYLLNNNWTFSDRRSRVFCLNGLARYHAVSFSSIFVHAGTLFALAGLLAVQPLIASLVAVSVAAAWSFSFNILWTWHTPRGAGVRPLWTSSRSEAAQP